MLLQLCALVGGLYQLQVKLFGYDNPTGKCPFCIPNSGPQIRGCCDQFSENNFCSMNLRCDSFFTYCLQLVGSTETECSYSGSVMSATNWNDSQTIDFSNSTVLNLQNPLTLPGLTNDYQVSYIYIC